MDEELHLLASNVKTTLQWGNTVLLSVYYSVIKCSYNSRFKLYIFDSNGNGYTSGSHPIYEVDIPHVSFLQIHYLHEDVAFVQLNTKYGPIDISAEFNVKLTAEHIEEQIIKYKALMNEHINLLTELNEKYYPTESNGLK